MAGKVGDRQSLEPGVIIVANSNDVGINRINNNGESGAIDELHEDRVSIFPLLGASSIARVSGPSGLWVRISPHVPYRGEGVVYEHTDRTCDTHRLSEICMMHYMKGSMYDEQTPSTT